MRAAVSVVLAGLLVTTPLKQVLAQAAQQDSTDAETSLVREQGSQPVIRVPALTPETALLWQPLAENRARENQVGGYVRVWAPGMYVYGRMEKAREELDLGTITLSRRR